MMDASQCNVHPILYPDAIFVKVKEEGHIRNKAVYLALAMTMEGQKEFLGRWIAKTEGAKFGLKMLTERQEQGIMPIRNRKATLSRFAVVFEGRVPTVLIKKACGTMDNSDELSTVPQALLLQRN